MDRNCPKCNKTAKPDDFYCSSCGFPLENVSENQSRAGVPWDERRNMGTAAAAYETGKAVLNSPSNFFENFKSGNKHWESILYCILFSILGALFYGIIILLYDSGQIQALIVKTLDNKVSREWVNSMYKWMLVANIVLAPIINIIVMYLWSGSMYLLLRFSDPGKANFFTTLQITSYAQTSQLAHAIPVFGGLLVYAGFIGFTVLGIKRRYNLTGFKAIILGLVSILFMLLIISLIIMSIYSIVKGFLPPMK